VRAAPGLGLERIDWSAAGTRAWIGMKTAMVIAGLITLVHAHRLRRGSHRDG
jgi:hypothetical protein